MLDPITLFWDRADFPKAVFTGDEVICWPPSLVETLTAAGILQQTANARRVACGACDTGHVEEVFSVPNPDGSLRFYIRCPENGRVWGGEERLFRWAIDFDALANLTARVLGTAGKVETLVPGRVWAVGRLIRNGVSQNVVVARGLTWPDAGSVVPASQRIRIATPPLVLALGRLPPEDFWGKRVPPVLVFDQVLDLGPPIHVHEEALDAVLGVTVAQPEAAVRAAKRSKRAAAIDALTNEMCAFLAGARDHAFSLKQRKRVPELLPRPTQKELAERVGVSPSTVGRCLQDPHAKQLRLLWDAADSLDQVMAFRG